ncbi:MAG: polyphenol oxidase family protein, partial [Bdellovibrionales bacterium]
MGSDFYYTVPEFQVGDQKDLFFHGFFGRGGGHSHGVYGSLNCGPGSDDNPKHVRANRESVAKAAGCDPECLLSLYQIHGRECVVIREPFISEDRPKADAQVTDVAGLALGVLTADCTPILFFGLKEDNAPVIGAAHAGWGGALKGVSESTVDAMVSLGAVKGSISACVGPCISQESYEVSDVFLEPFMKEDDRNACFFMPSDKDGHQLFDLAGYNISKLE